MVKAREDCFMGRSSAEGGNEEGGTQNKAGRGRVLPSYVVGEQEVAIPAEISLVYACRAEGCQALIS